ncbi:hypothetical protein [uncultured Methylobacterium sp.]|jgi:hypothetical protein|uniref:hypothetical protein n=1 Tax=uncultured Methylobacterium sp. TaxID=157278 RepID=UPI002629F9D8|nr:hypothetical protein [uncultured Methylobacterium sp.]
MATALLLDLPIAGAQMPSGPPATFSALTLSGSTFLTTSAAGSPIGNLVGKSAGSALRLVDDAGGAVGLNGTTLTVGATPPGAAGPLSVRVREEPVSVTAVARETTLTVTAQVLPTLGPLTASVNVGAAAGTVIASLSGLAPGEFATAVKPNDGRAVLTSAGNALVQGLTAFSAGAASFSVTTNRGRTLGVGVTAQVPAPAQYTKATDFVAGSVGMKWPNKQGTLNNAAFTKTCETLFFAGPPFKVPAGVSGVVAFSDRIRLEGDQSGTNETIFANDHTIEAVSISYTDAGGTARVATATNISGGGVCGPGSTTLGGVLAQMTLPAEMPANALCKYMVARSLPAGGQVPAYYRLKTGESFRGHATTSFASIVNAGGDPTQNTGSASAGITGAGQSSPGPSFVCFKGSDGRPAVITIGHSLNEGKGTDNLYTPADRSQGMLAVGLASTTNGYTIPFIDVSVAGADFIRRDPANASYNPNILAGMFGLIAQVTALNGGTAPVSHGISEDYNNSEQSPWQAQVAALKTCSINFLKGKIPGLPVIRTTSEIAVTSSTDGFATLGGQTAKSAVDRALFNVKLLSDLLDGTCVAALDVISAIGASGSATSTSADQGKYAVLSPRATVTRDYTSGAVIYLSAAPPVGTALNKQESGGTYQVKVVTAVAAQPEGDYAVTFVNGNGNSTWGAAAIGTPVQAQISSDVNPAVPSLHYSQYANGLISEWDGPNSFRAVKAQLKAAVSGAWT